MSNANNSESNNSVQQFFSSTMEGSNSEHQTIIDMVTLPQRTKREENSFSIGPEANQNLLDFTTLINRL